MDITDSNLTTSQKSVKNSELNAAWRQFAKYQNKLISMGCAAMSILAMPGSWEVSGSSKLIQILQPSIDVLSSQSQEGITASPTMTSTFTERLSDSLILKNRDLLRQSVAKLVQIAQGKGAVKGRVNYKEPPPAWWPSGVRFSSSYSIQKSMNADDLRKVYKAAVCAETETTAASTSSETEVLQTEQPTAASTSSESEVVQTEHDEYYGEYEDSDEDEEQAEATDQLQPHVESLSQQEVTCTPENEVTCPSEQGVTGPSEQEVNCPPEQEVPCPPEQEVIDQLQMQNLAKQVMMQHCGPAAQQHTVPAPPRLVPLPAPVVAIRAIQAGCIISTPEPVAHNIHTPAKATVPPSTSIVQPLNSQTPSSRTPKFMDFEEYNSEEVQMNTLRGKSKWTVIPPKKFTPSKNQ